MFSRVSPTTSARAALRIAAVETHRESPMLCLNRKAIVALAVLASAAGCSSHSNSSTVAAPNPTYFSVSAQANPSAGGTVSGAGRYEQGTIATVTATPATHYAFQDWTESGSRVSGEEDYQFTVNADRTLVAQFIEKMDTLDAEVADGNGTIKSTPAGINCGEKAGANVGTCEAVFKEGTQVTLVATADSGGYTFDHWGQDCNGTGSSCTILMNVRHSVVAYMTSPPPSLGLTVVLWGGGHGKVTSSPSGIDCTGGSAGCYATFPDTTTVTLTAAADSGSVWDNWADDCAGANENMLTCTLKMNQDHEAMAVFSVPEVQRQITVLGAGTGNGTVKDSINSINCTITAGTTSGTCSTSYPEGARIVLYANAASGYTFNGWSGACSGSTCAFDMGTSNMTATASFGTQPTFTLNVSGTGTGSGNVQSSSGGINCNITAGSPSGTCSASFTQGTSVTLTDSASSGDTFDGWSGDCQGSSCTLTMDANHSVTAKFSTPAPPSYTLAVVGTGTGDGTVTSVPVGIDCSFSAGSGSGTCSANFTAGTSVTLSAAPKSVSYQFGGWTGDCAGTNPCTVPMNESRTESAAFNTLASSIISDAPQLVSPPDGYYITGSWPFTWKAVTNAATYQFEVNELSSFMATDADYQNPTSTSVTESWTNLQEDKTYYWRVRGLNTARDGFGPWSAVRSFTLDRTARVQVWFDSVKVVGDGNSLGPGHFYWNFDLTSPIQQVIKDQPSSSPYDMSTGNTYAFGNSVSVPVTAGANVSISMSFFDSGFTGSAFEVGNTVFSDAYDHTTGTWEYIGHFQDEFNNNGADIIVYWTVQRIS